MPRSIVPEIGVQLHRARRHDRRRLQRLHRREPGFDVQLDLAVDAVAGDAFVGPATTGTPASCSAFTMRSPRSRRARAAGASIPAAPAFENNRFNGGGIFVTPG